MLTMHTISELCLFILFVENCRIVRTFNNALESENAVETENNHFESYFCCEFPMATGDK